MMFYFVSDKSDRDIQEGFLRVMQKNVATKTFSTRRSSTGVDKRIVKKCCNKTTELILYAKTTSMFMKQQTFCLLLKTEEDF